MMLSSSVVSSAFKSASVLPGSPLEDDEYSGDSGILSFMLVGRLILV